MARLERIVLQGFKSFKRKTSIPLPVGFSAITGPNGAGKSNVGDAISFVLGKSSAKALRAKKGENLIFHGSKSKSGADYANVVMYFDNSSGNLPVKEKEVSIGRRINKKGVSTYRLNGRIVTRQQVVDILSQAGIHPDGYNMIQQGDVNQMVEMDAIQRRKILDEIAGIKEYEEKKAKAMKELEKVAEKVREAEILLTEKSTVVEKIKAERDAALEYKNLQEEVVKVRDSILLKDYSKAKSSLRNIDKEVAEREKKFKKLDREIVRLDAALEKEENALDALTKEVVQASGQIAISKKIANLQSGIEARKMRIESLQREMDRLDSLIERVSRFEGKVNPGVKEVLKLPGVSGVLQDLVVVPANYRSAVEVAAGGHMRDIVVDTMETAVRCVNHLKKNRLGRARFLPLSKMLPPRKPPLPTESMGWLSDLVKYDSKYSPVIEFVFGRTACVDDIETAKKVIRRQRVRMVSLDGDLVEASGAVTGGHRKKAHGADVSGCLREKAGIVKEIDTIEHEIKVLGKDLSSLADREKGTRTFDAEKDRQGIHKRLESIREERREAYEQRLSLQQDIGKLNIQKAKFEARFDSLKLQVKKGGKPPLDMSISALKQREADIMKRLGEMGPVNMKALSEFDALMNEFEEFKEKVDKIVEERTAIQESINKIEARRLETFNRTLTGIAKHFREVYSDLVSGESDLVLEDPQNVESGLIIKASPPGKKLLDIDSMSGGEKTLTAFSFLFALQKYKPAPFYILDEADATLDRRNSEKVANLLRKQSKGVQYLIISHNDTVVRAADQIFGVTMRGGESKVMGIELPEK